MKRLKHADAPVDPAELAVGYMFPELFADESPLILRSQNYDESPFEPSATVQHAMPDMPPVDWNHIRARAAQQRRRPCGGAAANGHTANERLPRPPAAQATHAPSENT